MMRRWFSSVFPAVLFVAGLSAQNAAEAPISLPVLIKDQITVVPPAYPADLPTGEVAKIDDYVLTQADLLKQLLRNNLNAIAENLINTKMCELELQKDGVTISDEECLAEIEELMPRIAPGRTLDQVVAAGLYSKAYLMRTAATSRGWKKLLWKARNIPEDQRSAQTNQILMQLYMSEIKARYQILMRGQNPGPPAGALAALNTIINGKKVSYIVSPEEAMEFMIGILRPASIIAGQQQLIDAKLVDREMEKAGATVTDTEIESWVRQMNEKYPDPFNWTTILRFKGTNPDEERERWRQVQAWKRSAKPEITQEILDSFRREHEDFFRSRTVKAAHILFRCVDESTGQSKGPEAEAAALEKANRVYQLAREGVDFKKLAERYSEDETTAKNGGGIQMAIKKWGGGLDPIFQEAAYKLATPGQLAPPVRSALGYHVIQCVEVSPATDREIDWKEERYADWILEEFETVKMREWKKELTQKSKVSKVDLDKLLDLKRITFPKKSAQ